MPYFVHERGFEWSWLYLPKGTPVKAIIRSKVTFTAVVEEVDAAGEVVTSEFLHNLREELKACDGAAWLKLKDESPTALLWAEALSVRFYDDMGRKYGFGHPAIPKLKCVKVELLGEDEVAHFFPHSE